MNSKITKSQNAGINIFTFSTHRSNWSLVYIPGWNGSIRLMESFGGHNRAVGERGEAAFVAYRMKAITPAQSHVVEANIMHSSLGFESGGLASAHSIHNGLTQLAGMHDFYHGAKKAIGMLAGLFLFDPSKALIEKVYGFCEAVGLPTVANLQQ